jgi:hypothetical protein
MTERQEVVHGYTTDRWLQLCKLVEEISISAQPIDALVLRNKFRSKEEWEFAVKRLLDLGLVYWRDLGFSDVEISQSIALAVDRIGHLPEALKAEIDMLHAPMQCIAVGTPRKKKMPDVFVPADQHIFDELKEPNMNLMEGFAENDEGIPIYVTPDANGIQ